MCVFSSFMARPPQLWLLFLLFCGTAFTSGSQASPSSSFLSSRPCSTLSSTLRPSLRASVLPSLSLMTQSASLDNFPECDVLVVGGGLCGSTASFYLNQSGIKVLLLEEKESVGGCVNTHQGSLRPQSTN
jgi:hypothetical protein